ncbi:T9SS type A sorting domain-containing protein [Candidatus Poribacteria bacterium]|nr:T9SS type A sorting domain-containing protein [Candidatus Poribacteria bacterium]
MLSPPVTAGGNLSQNTSTRADGSYTVTFLDLLGIVAKIGDAVTVSVSRAMTGESAVGMVILTSQQLIDQTATVGVIFSGKAIFDLTIPQGISLIHIPLKVAEVDGNALEIKTIGDLYAVLGGSANVNFIITRDTAAGIWQSYLGEQNRRAPADRTLTDDLGIITVMKNPVTLRLKGDALGVDGKAQIHLQKGTNLVGVPLKSASLKRVSDLFSLTGIKDNATSIIVSDAGQFKVVSRPGDPGDITLIGGQSFLVTARQVGVADITGVAWDNVSSPASAAPPMAFVGHNVDESTPVLAVYGAVVEEFTGLAKEGFRVIAKNLSTGASISTPSGGDTPGGSYNVTVVDFRLGRAAQVGDTLEITVDTGNPLIGVQPLRHIVSPDDAKASQIQLPDLVAYRIPTETKLLPNYPNPFNPETWIPYRLARDASVTLTIYDTTGAVVQTLQVGHKPAAAYESKGKAIYWDGRNHFGERVASGVYFYTLTANDFTATRKMLILK